MAKIGRPKGSPNKRTLATNAKFARSGLLPLEFLLSRMRNEKLDEKDRVYAAVSAAPYMHARLTTVDAKISGDITIEVVRFGEKNRQAA